ncbi:MAG: hypothetical protein ACP5PB_08130 [Acidimicrobiales bacterium]
MAGATGLSVTNHTIVGAFDHELVIQTGVIVVLAIAAILVGVAVTGRAAPGEDAFAPEPLARRVVRVGFGVIWLLDGILQAQSAMPLGMIPQVVQPAASSSPNWVQHLVNVTAAMWNLHPVSVPASAVWIQVGLGIWLLGARRGIWSRMAGWSSVAWGLFVWVFGEAFGGLFAPGLSWMTGAPGGVLFYCAAGVLVALPERAWESPRLGRAVLAAMGGFFVVMAAVQAWPGRGYWRGASSHGPGTLLGAVRASVTTPQPSWLRSLVSGFASMDAAHGWAVNLVTVVALGVVGALLVRARPPWLRGAVVAGVLACLADWILVQDMGFWGGVGTDPNSMLPIALLLVTGYLAVVSIPATRPAAPPVRRRTGVRASMAASLVALAMLVVGVVPAVAAASDPRASTILAHAAGTTVDALDAPSPWPGWATSDPSTSAASSVSPGSRPTVLAFLAACRARGVTTTLRAAQRDLGALGDAVNVVVLTSCAGAVGVRAHWRVTRVTPTALSRWRTAFEHLSDAAATPSRRRDAFYVLAPDGQVCDAVVTGAGLASGPLLSSNAVVLADVVNGVARGL